MLQPQLRKLLNLPLELVPLKRLSFLPAGLSFSPPLHPLLFRRFPTRTPLFCRKNSCLPDRITNRICGKIPRQSVLS